MEFDVMPGKLNTVASDQREVQRKINQLKAELESCKKNLRGCLSSSASVSITRAIDNVNGKMGNVAVHIGVMGNKLDTIATMYTKTEAGIAAKRISAKRVIAATNYNVDGSANKWGVAEKATNAVKRVGENIKNFIKDLKTSYDSRGTAYYAVQYGLAAVKAVGAVAKIAGAITTIVGTGGIATVPALCALVSGVNDLCNVTGDVININKGNFDQIGKTNVLKSSLSYAGEKMGGETGGKIGSYAYYGIDLVGNLFSLGQAVGGLSKLESVNKVKLASEVKGIGNAIKTTKASSLLQNVKYQATLAKYAFPETTKLVKNAGMIYKVVDKTKDTIESEYVFLNNGEKTNLFDGYNNVNKAIGNTKKGIKVITKIDTTYHNLFARPAT